MDIRQLFAQEISKRFLNDQFLPELMEICTKVNPEPKVKKPCKQKEKQEKKSKNPTLHK